MLLDILPSVLASLVVGMSAAWLASQKALATYGHRLSEAEKAIERIDTISRGDQALLVELKTKIDLILERLLPL